MDTDNLIKQLSDDAKPVKKLMTPGIRTLLWIPVAIICVGFALSYLGGFRYDMEDKICQPGFLAESVAIFLAGLAATYTAFRLSLPQARISQKVKLMIGFFTLVWIGLTFNAAFNANMAELEHELAGHGGIMHCLTDALTMAGLPILILLVMIRRAAPTHFGLTGYAALLATLSFAALGARYMCSVDAGAHIFIWHFLPVLIIGLTGIWLGRILLKW